MSNDLLNVFEKHKFDIEAAKKSQTWFRQQITLLKSEKLLPQRVYTHAGSQAGRIQVGSLYMFFYDPKLKNELPYYDKFPLVFPFSKTPDGFIGLNLHYLNPRLRVKLLDKLMKFKTTKGITENTRLRYNYDMLKGVSMFPFAQHCVKRYLKTHIITQIKLIPPEDWVTAMMLPVESFSKATANKVWKNTGGVL